MTRSLWWEYWIRRAVCLSPSSFLFSLLLPHPSFQHIYLPSRDPLNVLWSCSVVSMVANPGNVPIGCILGRRKKRPAVSGVMVHRVPACHCFQPTLSLGCISRLCLRGQQPGALLNHQLPSCVVQLRMPPPSAPRSQCHSLDPQGWKLQGTVDEWEAWAAADHKLQLAVFPFQPPGIQMQLSLGAFTPSSSNSRNADDRPQIF